MKKYRLFYMIDEGGNVLEVGIRPSHWETKYNISGVDVLKSSALCNDKKFEVGFSKVRFKMIEI